MAPGFNYKTRPLELWITHLEESCILPIITATELINKGHNFKGIAGRNRWELQKNQCLSRRQFSVFLNQGLTRKIIFKLGDEEAQLQAKVKAQLQK